MPVDPGPSNVRKPSHSDPGPEEGSAPEEPGPDDGSSSAEFLLAIAAGGVRLMRRLVLAFLDGLDDDQWPIAWVLLCILFVFLPSAGFVLKGSVLSGLKFLVLGGGLFTALFLVFGLWRDRRQKRAIAISGLDSMNWRDFMDYVAVLFEHKGYSILEFTHGRDEMGVDFLAEKHGAEYAVQCKHVGATTRKTDAVDHKGVQQVVAGVKYWDCDACIVVTNGYYTEKAKILAKVNDCILIDRRQLLKWVLSHTSAQ